MTSCTGKSGPDGSGRPGRSGPDFPVHEGRTEVFDYGLQLYDVGEFYVGLYQLQRRRDP